MAELESEPDLKSPWFFCSKSVFLKLTSGDEWGMGINEFFIKILKLFAFILMVTLRK